MRYPAAEKLEIIRLVEGSHLPVRRTHAPGTGRTSGGRSRAAPPIGDGIRRTDRCDASTSRMLSSFSAAGYLIRGRPQPRHALF